MTSDRISAKWFQPFVALIVTFASKLSNEAIDGSKFEFLIESDGQSLLKTL